MQRCYSKGSIRGELLIGSSSFTVFCLEVFHILLRRLTFYKDGKSTWPTMKNALFERHISTNIIKHPCLVVTETKVFIIKWQTRIAIIILYSLCLPELFKRGKLS